jgi:hypothetical protein
MKDQEKEKPATRALAKPLVLMILDGWGHRDNGAGKPRVNSLVFLPARWAIPRLGI